MKKKFKIISKTIILLVYLATLTTNLFAFETDCSRLLTDIKKYYETDSLGDMPTIIQTTFGFELAKKFSESKDEFVFARDEKNYYSVGKILSPIVHEKGLKIGDKLISLNGNITKNLNEDQISKILLDSNTDKLSIECLTGDTKKNITLSKVETEHVEKILIADLKSLQINEKEGSFTANISLNFMIQYLDSHKIVELSEKHLTKFFEDTGKWDSYKCEYDWEKWGDTGMPFPNVNHDNRIEYNLNLNQYYVEFYPFSKKTGFYDEDSVEITFFDEGLMKFSHNYNLRNFPFDKQKLNIDIIDTVDIERSLLRYSDYSPRNLKSFINKSSLPGWKLTGSDIRYEIYQNPNNLEGFVDDKLIIEILVERKHGYYIYKVIFPILLILMVCWSAVFIDPKELESRLTITIVCLLSLIAYNFVIDSELPKLDYLTVMDYIILVSYVYATIPNFLSVISFSNIKMKNKNLALIESYSKRYGIFSYIFIIFVVIFYNANQDPNTAALFGWLVTD